MALLPSLWAQLPIAQLRSVFPPVLQQGVTNEVVIAGEALDEPLELRFSSPRVSAVPKAGSGLTFLVSVPGSAECGGLEVRAVSRFGVSNPRVMTVLSTPATRTASEAKTAETAQVLAANAWAVGRVEPEGARWFRGKASGGASLSVEVASDSLDSMLEPVLTVFGPDRREIAHQRGAFVDFVAPPSGEFWFSLHDQTIRGGEAYPFLLRWTGAPRIELACPTVLRRGVTHRVQVFGRRLPDGHSSGWKGGNGQTLEGLEAYIFAPAFGTPGASSLLRPAGYGLDLYDWSLTGPDGVSSPWPFLLVDEPVLALSGGTLEVEPPVAVGGIFGYSDETNRVQFAAHKGQTFWMEIDSDRLGFSTAPSAVVERLTTNSQGRVESHEVLTLPKFARITGQHDLPDATRDPEGRFEAPEDGHYQVVLRNQFALGRERPRRPFVLRIVPQGRLNLVAVPASSAKAKDDDRHVYPASAVLRRGETVAVHLFAMHGGVADGLAQVFAEGLPSGVSATPVAWVSGKNSAVLLLTASTDAPFGHGSLQIRGKWNESALVESVATPATVVWPVTNYDEEAVRVRPTHDMSVSVMADEQAPVTLTARGPFEGTSGSKVKVDWTVLRRADWTANPKLKLYGHPDCNKFPEVELDSKATNLTTEINLAEVKLPEGRHWLWLQAPVTIKYRDRPEAVAVAEEELKQAVAAESAATEPEAKKVAGEKKKAAEERKKAMEERAKPRDVVWTLYSQPFALEVKK